MRISACGGDNLDLETSGEVFDVFLGAKIMLSASRRQEGIYRSFPAVAPFTAR